MAQTATIRANSRHHLPEIHSLQHHHQFRTGEVVLTKFGVGVIVQCRWDQDHDRDRVRDRDRDRNRLDGDEECTNTNYHEEDKGGVNDDNPGIRVFVVRLWRVPFMSIGSSSLAYLQASAILLSEEEEELPSPLPAAPGMKTTLKNQLQSQQQQVQKAVLVYNYNPSRQTYKVILLPNEQRDPMHSLNFQGRQSLPPSPQSAVGGSPTLYTHADSPSFVNGGGGDDIFREVSWRDLEPAQSAKFYPILETLMQRADSMAATAAALLNQESTRKLVASTDHALQHQMTQLQNHPILQDKALSSNGIVTSTTISPGTISATTAEFNYDESARQVLQLMKDQQLTELLETCRNRLRQLVQGDVPEQTLLVLEQAGIRINNNTAATNNHPSSASAGDGIEKDSRSVKDDYGDPELTLPTNWEESVDWSRKVSLLALEQWLNKTQVNPEDFESFRQGLSTQFATTFDSLSVAAQSDRTLSAIFYNVQEKTSEWQQLNGRLLQTRSASLFIEGASRLQARALAILNHSQAQWAGEVGSLLTKSFTEGDAALARLKSIELGDAVKNRLVDAIQIRSESLGGLDGIIAGALSTVQTHTTGTSSASTTPMMIRELLMELHQKSSTVTANAHETLLAVLSSRSQYREVALLRLEAALVSLEDQMGDTWSPEQLALIASGEGGTSQIFEPIAQRAAQEIERQLNAAEQHVSDTTVLQVLKRIRKIISGQLTVHNVMDEVVSILNDDQVVAAGETFVQHSEHVLDVIEGASRNQAVADAIKLVERAGITKETVMNEIGKLNVNELLDTAGSAVTDERARLKLLSQATDTALDFLLRILPSMPVPPLEGVNEGLVYQIANLSMEGFKVRKEDIQIELAGMRATRRQLTPVSNPINPGSGSVIDTDFDVVETVKIVKATELLIIDIRNISAILDQAKWSFEQTYMPYWKGQGFACVRLSGGAIRLQFELRKRLIEVKEESTTSVISRWEPVLCLHDRTCTILDVDLELQGQGSLNWILNKLVTIFKGPLRDYVVRTIVNVLTSKSGWILEQLNHVLRPYWELILRTAQLGMANLVETDESVVIKETCSMDRTIIELVWRERLPLGMNLLMNDESGKLKVVDFPRGSQARAVCEKRGINPDVFKGAAIIGVNGTEYDDQKDLFDALRDTSRPKTVCFVLSDSADAERIRKFVNGDDDQNTDDFSSSADEPRQFKLRNIDFTEPGELGVEFTTALDNIGLVVKGFIEGLGGTALAAEKTGLVHISDILVKVNDEISVCTDGSGRSLAVQLLTKASRSRPLRLTFSEPYLFKEVIDANLLPKYHSDGDGGPEELCLEEVTVEVSGTKRIVLKGFNNVRGTAESSGVLIGDHLVFVNGMPVGAGCRWLGVAPPPTLSEIQSMMSDEKVYPMGLTFARPRRQGKSRWTGQDVQMLSDKDSDTMCVTFEQPSQLDCVFNETRIHDIVVSDFQAVPGVFQRSLSKYARQKIQVSIDSINSQCVPSYASCDMVYSAIQRSWKADQRVEVRFCDDTYKHWVHAIASNV